MSFVMAASLTVAVQPAAPKAFADGAPISIIL